MRIHKRTAVALAAALIGSLPLIGAGAGTAAAEETSVALPSTSFRDIVVDGVHDRVFVSDPTGGSIVVTDYAGAVVQQITAEEGAAGLVLSADSTKLYVALSTVGAIAEIDTVTLTETDRYPTGADTSPQSLAMAGGKLWFGYTVGSSGGIGSLDVASSAPAATLVPSGRYWYYAPALASSPADPNVLVAGEEGVSPASLAVYDTAADGLQKRTERSFISSPSISYLNDFAVTADGQNIVIAANNPSDHQIVRLSDLSSNGYHSSWQFPNAVAVAADGTVATGAEGDFVKTYRPGSTWPAVPRVCREQPPARRPRLGPGREPPLRDHRLLLRQCPHAPRPPGRRKAGHHPQPSGPRNLPQGQGPDRHRTTVSGGALPHAARRWK